MNAIDGLVELLGSDDPDVALHGVELMFVLPQSVWLPLLDRLDEITPNIYRAQAARWLARLSRWDVAAKMGVSIKQVVRWELGEPVGGAAADLCCITGRRVLPDYLRKPPMPRAQWSTIDHQGWYFLDLSCDVPGCTESVSLRGQDALDVEMQAAGAGWRLDPENWCYCPQHRRHPPVGGPAAMPRQLALFGGAR